MSKLNIIFTLPNIIVFGLCIFTNGKCEMFIQISKWYLAITKLTINFWVQSSSLNTTPSFPPAKKVNYDFPLGLGGVKASDMWLILILKNPDSNIFSVISTFRIWTNKSPLFLVAVYASSSKESASWSHRNKFCLSLMYRNT